MGALNNVQPPDTAINDFQSGTTANVVPPQSTVKFIYLKLARWRGGPGPALFFLRCFCREKRLFWQVVVEKMDFLGSCCRNNRLPWR